ncbi:CPXV047 protein [Cowpox virus]|uniref:CPXV047 protein n=1 Tax=Cowpox virus TaxID=10243 RepID=U5TA42_COWPX|nr:CPXV047 protein [Cowpox virus]
MLMHSYSISGVKKNYPIMYLRVLYVANIIAVMPISFRYSRVLELVVALSRGVEMSVI